MIVLVHQHCFVSRGIAATQAEATYEDRCV
jgi:hypothetical protein